MNILKYLVIVLIPPLLLSCGGPGEVTKEDDKIAILATTGMVGDLVRNIGGVRVEVQTLMGPGVDPHLYKASAGDLDKLQSAEMIYCNGLELEGKMGDILERMANTGKKIVAVGEFADEIKLFESQQYKGQADPHIWFDVSLWASTIDGVAAALSEVRPEHEEAFRANAEEYRDALAELHQWCLRRLNEIPEKGRVLITAHDAFQYFGQAYDVEVVGLQGISTASEYGPRDIERIVNLIVERGIKAVFIESSVPRRSIEAVVEGARQLGQEVVIGGELFSDAMGEAGTEEGSYIGMVRHNVNTIVESLK